MNESNDDNSGLCPKGLAYQPPPGEYLHFFRFDLKDGSTHIFQSTELRHVHIQDAGTMEFVFYTHLVVLCGSNFQSCADRLMLRQLVWFQELSELEVHALQKGTPAVTQISVYPIGGGPTDAYMDNKASRKSRILA